MATRSSISQKQGNVYKTIYCHNDGYIERTGVAYHLYHYWNDADKIKEMIAAGDTSYIGKDLENSGPYSRDRGEPASQTRAKTYRSMEAILQSDSRQEYNYLYDEGEWYVNRMGKDDEGFIPLHYFFEKR